jgi:alpha-tubulin suppressor-like RCC1 family protein
MTNYLNRIKLTFSIILVLVLTVLLQPFSTFTHSASALKAEIPIVKLVTGYKQSYALDAKGRIWAWGKYDRSSSAQYLPKLLDWFPDHKVVDLIGYDDGLYILMSDGTVWSWGSNERGELGIGNREETTEPVQLTTLANIVAIGPTLAGGHAIEKDGTLWKWGHSVSETRDKSRLAYPQIIGTVPGKIIKLNYDYALLEDGTVWSLWEFSIGPLEIPQKVLDITESSSAILAVGKDGGLFAWGDYWDNKGKLNFQERGDYIGFYDPIQVSPPASYTQVSGGVRYFTALKKDGSVWAWGSNEKGQLANSDMEESKIPLKVKGLPTIASIYTGEGNFHSLALAKDGSVWAWGSNTNYELGATSKESKSNTPIRIHFVELPTIENVHDEYNYQFYGSNQNQLGNYALNSKGTIVTTSGFNGLVSKDHGSSWSTYRLPTTKSEPYIMALNDYFFIHPEKGQPLYWSVDGTKWNALLPNEELKDATLLSIQLLEGKIISIWETSPLSGTAVYSWNKGSEWVLEGRSSGLFTKIFWNGSTYTGVGYAQKVLDKPTKKNQFSESYYTLDLTVYTSKNLKDWTYYSGHKVNSSPSNNQHTLPVAGSSTGSGNQTVIGLMTDFGNVWLESVNGLDFKKVKAYTSPTGSNAYTEIFKVNNLYLAYGANWRNEGFVTVSKDNKTWKEQKIKGIDLGMIVTWTGKQFVGFSRYDGLIAISKNGLDWQIIRKPLIRSQVSDVVYVNGKYVAVGSEYLASVPAIFNSNDGKNWTTKLLASKTSSEHEFIVSVAWTGKQYVAVGSNMVWLSTDGVTWKSSKPFGKQTLLKKIKWDGSKLILIGNTNFEQNASFVSTSTDGKTWTKLLTKNANFQDLEVHNKSIAIIGYQGEKAYILSTANGTQWAEKTFKLKAFSPYHSQSVIWGNGKFVASGDRGRLYTSSNGEQWNEIIGDFSNMAEANSGLYDSSHIVWTGKEYWYFDSNHMNVSTDLINWSFYDLDYSLTAIRRVIWVKDHALIVGEDGLIAQVSKK